MLDNGGSKTVSPDLAKFHHFGKYLKSFGNIFKVYLVLGKVFYSLWHNLYAIGQIFIAENGQLLKTQFGHLITLLQELLYRCGLGVVLLVFFKRAITGFFFVLFEQLLHSK